MSSVRFSPRNTELGTGWNCPLSEKHAGEQAPALSSQGHGHGMFSSCQIAIWPWKLRPPAGLEADPRREQRKFRAKVVFVEQAVPPSLSAGSESHTNRFFTLIGPCACCAVSWHTFVWSAHTRSDEAPGMDQRGKCLVLADSHSVLVVKGPDRAISNLHGRLHLVANCRYHIRWLDVDGNFPSSERDLC